MAKNDYAVHAVHPDAITVCVGGQSYDARYTVETIDGVKWATLQDEDTDVVKQAGNYDQRQWEGVQAVMLEAIEQ